MLTLFSIPKPFQGHIGTIQTNAIQSWTLLRPACEIILFGNEEGTAEIAAKFGVQYIPDVEHNEYGTPLLNSLFDKAQQLASHRILCYVNADIILMSDFLRAVDRVRRRSFLFRDRPFLLIGRRRDVAVEEAWDFTVGDWEERLQAYVQESGTLHSDWGIDYFVFFRGLWGKIPPFAIGRTAWDNWLIYRARFLCAQVIDATNVVTALHQNHEYSHSTGGKTGIFEGPEAKCNRELAGGEFHFSFSIRDATWILAEPGLWPALTRTRLRRRKQTGPVLLRQRLRGWLERED